MSEKTEKMISHGTYLRMKANPHLLTPEHKEKMRKYEEMIRAKLEAIPHKKPGKPKKPVKLLNSYEELMEFFKETAGNLVENYVLDEQNIVQIDFALRYFYGLPLPEDVAINKVSHKKGLLLFGNYGTGKSMLFRIINEMRPSGMRFKFLSASDIVAMYETDGEKGLIHLDGKKILIDELGAEKTGFYYGSKMNVLQHVLLKRYNLFIEKGLRTHATTNLSMEEVREMYGPRVYSRFFEMFNLVPFGAEPDARDFRMLK